MDRASITPIASDDRQLVERATRGDRGAFEQLVKRYQRRVFAVALGMLRNADDARDVCQESFLKAYRNLAGFNGASQFYTWLYRIVWNGCLDHLRKQRRVEVEFDETIAPDGASDETGTLAHHAGADPAAALVDKELRRDILASLATLSPAHRTVLVLREVDGLSYDEIAEVVGCPVGTVMSRLFHARKKMQERLRVHREPVALAA